MAHPATVSVSTARGLGTDNDALSDAVASITVADKCPQFWKSSARLWFSTFESIIAPQKRGDDYKFGVVISKLSKEEVLQVSDILLDPPAENKYLRLKERLISCYEESEQQRFNKLLDVTSLGDQKPSQLLRKMKESGCGSVNEDTLRLLWIRQLPPSMTSVLAVMGNATMDKLSEVADRIYENTRNNGHTSSAVGTDVNSITDLASQLAAIQLEIAALKKGHARQNARVSNQFKSRYGGSNFRASSRQRSSVKRQGELCHFHRKFGKRAYKCAQPCSWKNRPRQSEN